ncbi:MAG: hypothetical protein NTX08_03140, partial [Sphingobacteriales bacterium]|nr:hypothetical protein [Sphingobacteriales bacterium]
LVPGEWMRKMFEPFYGNKVIAWPVGIDTKKWNPFIKKEITIDFLIYDKIRWKHDDFEDCLINPIIRHLVNNNLSFEMIRYGFYTHENLLDKLSHCKFVIFLCEHETQGLAYQQILATNTPILAWDRGSYWQDPLYFPDRVKYEPVSSVPYWDDRCGLRFKNIEEFPNSLEIFMREQNNFNSKKFIEENLSLEICAKKYVQIIDDIRAEN